MLLIHSIHFCCCFYSFHSYSMRILDSLQIGVISTNAYRSVARMTQVFDLEKCSISKTLLQVFKRENDLMQ